MSDSTTRRPTWKNNHNGRHNRDQLLTASFPQVLKRLPKLRKLDGMPIDVDERELAKAA
jgi:hypothetical protein